MKLIAAFVAILFALAVLSPVQQSTPPVTQAGAPPVAAPPAAAMMRGGELTLERAPDGHFYTDAQVNGTTIRFLVDTGASSIALSKADAQRIGIPFGAHDFTETGEGAGGKIALKPVLLDRVTIGTLEATAVDAVVIDSPMQVSLLGQSWLKRLASVEIRGDRLTMR